MTRSELKQLIRETIEEQINLKEFDDPNYIPPSDIELEEIETSCRNLKDYADRLATDGKKDPALQKKVKDMMDEIKEIFDKHYR